MPGLLRTPVVLAVEALHPAVESGKLQRSAQRAQVRRERVLVVALGHVHRSLVSRVSRRAAAGSTREPSSSRLWLRLYIWFSPPEKMALGSL